MIVSFLRASAFTPGAVRRPCLNQAAPGVLVSEAVAQDKPKKDTRERRTPALRNKV